MPTERTGTRPPPPAPQVSQNQQRGRKQRPTLAPAQRQRAPRKRAGRLCQKPTHESCRCFYFLGRLEPCALFPLHSAINAHAARIPAARAPCQALRWQNPMSSAAHWVGKLAAFMPRPIIYTRHPLRQLPKTWVLISQRCVSSPALQSQNNSAPINFTVKSRIKPSHSPGDVGQGGETDRGKQRQLKTTSRNHLLFQQYQYESCKLRGQSKTAVKKKKQPSPRAENSHRGQGRSCAC